MTNVDVEIAKLKAAKPDVIFFTSFLNDAVLITRALHAQKVDCLGYVTYAAGFAAPKYLESVGDLSNYIFAISKFDYDHNRPMEAELDAEMMRRNGVHANHFSASLYAMAYVVKDVLERTGSIDREKVRDAIAATDISSGKAMMMPGTHIRFDSNGENTGAADLMAQCLNRDWHTVWPPEWKRKFDPVWPMPKWEERKV